MPYVFLPLAQAHQGPEYFVTFQFISNWSLSSSSGFYTSTTVVYIETSLKNRISEQFSWGNTTVFFSTFMAHVFQPLSTDIYFACLSIHTHCRTSMTADELSESMAVELYEKGQQLPMLSTADYREYIRDMPQYYHLTTKDLVNMQCGVEASQLVNGHLSIRLV